MPHRHRGRRVAAESPLRKACERAKTAVAIGCYPDGERDLAKLIDDELRVSNLRIAPDARATLMALLGGDRQASRNELRKLALYAHGKGEVTIEDVMAVVADASEMKIDPIVDGAFAGKPDLVETEFAKAMIAGTYPGMIISAAQRQAAWLHKTALAVAEGTPVSTLLDSGFPRLHFSRKANVETALRNFNATRLVSIIEQLATAALEMRKQAPLAAVIAQRTLLSIAANAKRRGLTRSSPSPACGGGQSHMEFSVLSAREFFRFCGMFQRVVPVERQGPITARTFILALEQRAFFTFEVRGYGSLRSQGRPAESLCETQRYQHAAQFSYMRLPCACGSGWACFNSSRTSSLQRLPPPRARPLRKRER